MGRSGRYRAARQPRPARAPRAPDAGTSAVTVTASTCCVWCRTSCGTLGAHPVARRVLPPAREQVEHALELQSGCSRRARRRPSSGRGWARAPGGRAPAFGARPVRRAPGEAQARGFGRRQVTAATRARWSVDPFDLGLGHAPPGDGELQLAAQLVQGPLRGLDFLSAMPLADPVGLGVVACHDVAARAAVSGWVSALPASASAPTVGRLRAAPRRGCSRGRRPRAIRPRWRPARRR